MSRPGLAVPLLAEAAAFADHYGFAIDVLAAYRPTGKGRVERQVAIVRDHVTAGRRFASLAQLDGAFAGWVPIAPRPGAPHPRGGHRRARRRRPRRARGAAGGAVSGLRPAPAPGRQGLPGLVRGQPVFGARHPGARHARSSTSAPGSTRWPSTPCLATAGVDSCWQRTPARRRRGAGSSTRRTGTGYPTDTPAPSPPAMLPRRRPASPAAAGTGAGAGAARDAAGIPPSRDCGRDAPAAERLRAGHPARHAARGRLTRPRRRLTRPCASPYALPRVTGLAGFPLFPSWQPAPAPAGP